MKENYRKNTFMSIVKDPNHNCPQKNHTETLPKYPYWRLMGLAIGNNMLYCSNETDDDACFKSPILVLQRLGNITTPTHFFADRTNKKHKEKNDNR